MFTCMCGTSTDRGVSFKVGMLCQKCAAFMRREEASFEDEALRAAERTEWLLAQPILMPVS